jgi:heterodisulfide reductase subunit A
MTEIIVAADMGKMYWSANDAGACVGAGVAGMQASLDLANSGITTYLVESKPSIGGRMSQLDKTFPTLDCSQCILTPKMVDVGRNPLIKLMTYSEVDAVEGFIGNFDVTIRKKARGVLSMEEAEAKGISGGGCNGCGDCDPPCPVIKPNEFEQGMKPRKAIYIPFPQAVPNRPVIDKEHCAYFLKGRDYPFAQTEVLKIHITIGADALDAYPFAQQGNLHRLVALG